MPCDEEVAYDNRTEEEAVAYGQPIVRVTGGLRALSPWNHFCLLDQNGRCSDRSAWYRENL